MTLNVVGSFLLWLGRMRAYVDLRLSNALGGGAVYSADIGPPAGVLYPAHTGSQYASRRDS